METSQALAAIKARSHWNADNVAIFADVHDRTGMPIATGGFEDDVEFAVRLGGADGLVLTGKCYAQTLISIALGPPNTPAFRSSSAAASRPQNFGEVRRHRRRRDRQFVDEGLGHAPWAASIPAKVKHSWQRPGKRRAAA